MSTATAPNQIRWQQIWSLFALDLAIIISWIAYHKYQPGLVTQFGFAEFALELTIVQGFILFITPPIAGRIADRIRQKKGERLPVINLGINFVSMVFMVVAVTIFAEPSGWIKNLFPVMIVFWLVAMNIFHSPAISTLELFVPEDKLPRVMALFVISADLLQALEPSIVDLIDLFGAPVTFATGGVLVFVTGFFFMRAMKQFQLAENSGATVQVNPNQESGQSNFLMAFLLGAAFGTALTFFFNFFPLWAAQRFDFLDPSGFNGNYFVSALIALSALLAWPASKWAEKNGTRQAAFIAFLICLVLIPLAYLLKGYAALPAFILFPAAFALLSVTALPMAFGQLSSRDKVFGIGLFFSGAQLADSVTEVISLI